MILPWKNYLETNEVYFQLNEHIKYIAYPNGNSYILKQETDKTDVIFEKYPDWEDEKQWISDNYSDVYGVYEPCNHSELDDDDDKQCLFGKTSNGLYLDRIQRPEFVMNHDMTTEIIVVYHSESSENSGRYHTPDNGNTIFRTTWCDDEHGYYNCMRCDVFPENPGWQTISKEEVISLMKKYPEFIYNQVELEEAIELLRENQWFSPVYKQESILGNWLIP